MYYYGDEPFGPAGVFQHPEIEDPYWYLDGMTPIKWDCVLDMLEARGINVDKFKKYFLRIEEIKLRSKSKRREIIARASKKLTRLERIAVGIQNPQ